MSAKTQIDEIGSGILSRASATVYRGIVLAVFLIAVSLPTVAIWTLLGRDGSNGPIFVLAMLPIAPGLSAALFALRSWSHSPDLQPTKALRRGYAKNVRDVLKWWAIVLVIASILVINVVFSAIVPAGNLIRPVCIVVLAALIVWSGHLLVVTSFFSFRTRDAMRIAAALSFSQWKASLGFLSLGVIATAVVGVTSEAVLALLAWLFAVMLWQVARPVAVEVEKVFIGHE